MFYKNKKDKTYKKK